jgi:hypothetical protein
MKNPDHISECLETIFWIKILKFFEVDTGSEFGMEQIRIRDPEWKKFGFRIQDEHPGTSRNIPDPQHCTWPLVKYLPPKGRLCEEQCEQRP